MKQTGGEIPKIVKSAGCIKQAKTGKNNTKALVQSNRYMVPSIDSLFTHNIHLKIKELWVKRQKIITKPNLLSNPGGIFWENG